MIILDKFIKISKNTIQIFYIILSMMNIFFYVINIKIFFGIFIYFIIQMNLVELSLGGSFFIVDALK